MASPRTREYIMTYQLTTGTHNESADTLGEFSGETFDDREDAQSAADYLNEHLDGIGAAFRVSVERAS
jgi:hypothetical protein